MLQIADGTTGKVKPNSWNTAVQSYSSSLLSSHTLLGKVTAASRASSCPQGNNCRQHAKYSFALVTFCHLLSGQVKPPDAALLLHLGFLIISVNLITFSSWRPKAHDHRATLTPKISEAQESRFSWEPCETQNPQAGHLSSTWSQLPIPSHDLSTMETSRILTTRKAHKNGSYPNRL